MEEYSIKDLEKITGIKAHTIRMWEKRYKIFCPKRTNSNLRVYCNEDLKKLMSINTLLKNGYKISQIASFTDEELKDKIIQLLQSKSDSNIVLENLILATFELDEEKFDKIYTRSILQLGFEETFIKIICPFLKKIELFWQIGKINQIHKNFVSNLIRNKIIIAIDAQIVVQYKEKTILFFLPEKEYNEIKILFFMYFARKKAFKTIYLGQNVPINDLKETFLNKKIDYVVFAYETMKNVSEIRNYVNKVKEIFPSSNIIICCEADENLIISDVTNNIFYINNSEKFLEVLNRL